MSQLVCINKADLRIELGRLRHERHAIDHELQRLESELSTLKARKTLNGHQIRAIEKQLVHADGASVCMPRQEDFQNDNAAMIPQDASLTWAILAVDTWFLAAICLLIAAAAVWGWFL